jgi:hypothetical protein
LGGGLFADMFKDATAMIRNYITTHGNEYEAIICAKTFTDYFSVKGEALKNVYLNAALKGFTMPSR